MKLEQTEESEISRLFNLPSMIVTMTSTSLGFIAIVLLMCKTKGKDIKIEFLLCIGLYFVNLATSNLRYFLQPWSIPRIAISNSTISLSECLLFLFTF